MDSCHIFNFLFGTKKATTELSKCFSNTLNEVTRKKSNKAANKTTQQASSELAEKSVTITTCNRETGQIKTETATTSSDLSREISPPIRQNQIKLINSSPSNGPQVNKPTIPLGEDANVYRATLVHSIEDYEFQKGDGRQPDRLRNDNNLTESKDRDQYTINDSPARRNKQYEKSERVKSLVKSFELNKVITNTAIVRPLPHKSPPKTPVKSLRAKCLNFQLILNKPASLCQLFQDHAFLTRFFAHLEPIERCTAAQVCRKWRQVLYSKQTYWKDLVSVIDCTQLRREHLAECILNTLNQSVKLKQQQQMRLSSNAQQIVDTQDEIWRIQELCNRYTAGRNGTNASSRTLTNGDQLAGNIPIADNSINNNHQMINSKSSSIPSQISSTLSSISISSLLSPLSESSRVESIKEKLYSSLDNRGFDAICLFGATDEDIEDLVYKSPNAAHIRIQVGRLNNCCISDRGLELFISTFNQLEELELSGCNEITNAIDLRSLSKLKRLIITDCINIADGVAQHLIQMFHRLDELTIQAYHLTDAFLEYISLNSDTSRLRKLELPNCKELTDQSMLTIAKLFPSVEILSISGSTKISDDGIEILCEQAKQLRSLNLSWCTKITDASLECIACDLTSNLEELILDRNIHLTDVGLSYLTAMKNLKLVYIRWCPRITDLGVESLLSLKTLRYLSLAGLHQVTARSLLSLIEVQQLEEVELTNCSAVNGELLIFLATRMPKCNLIY